MGVSKQKPAAARNFLFRIALAGMMSAGLGAGAQTLPSADQILAKYEDFLGGASALSKVTTRVTRSRRLETGAQVSDEVLVRFSKRPMLSIMHHEALDGTFVSYTNGCDAAGGWVGYGKPNSNGAPNPGRASTDGVCEQEQYYYEYLPLDLKRLEANVRQFQVKGMTQIAPADPGAAGGLAGGHGRDLILAGARTVYLVLSVPMRAGDSYEWLYFDSKTGALLRRAEAGTGPAPVPPGENPRFTDFIQYREVGDGTRAPFQFVTTAPNSQVRGVSVSVIDNQPVADDVFQRPKDVRREDKGL